MAYPTTFVDLQNSVLSKGRLDTTDDRAKVKDWINQVTADLCLEAEVLGELATMTTTAGQASYVLPAGAVRIKGMYVTGDSVPMEQVSLDSLLRMRQRSPARTSGGPTKYAIVGLYQVEVYPTPSSVTTINVWYLRASTPMVNDSDVPELPEPYASKAIEYGALVEASDFKRDDQQGNYQQQYERWTRKLRAHVGRHRSGVPSQVEIVGYPNLPMNPDQDSGY